MDDISGADLSGYFEIILGLCRVMGLGIFLPQQWRITWKMETESGRLAFLLRCHYCRSQRGLRKGSFPAIQIEHVVKGKCFGGIVGRDPQIGAPVVQKGSTKEI